MRYTFLLYTDPANLAHLTADDWEKEKQLYGTYIQDLNAAGVFVDTDRLTATHTATTLTRLGGTERIQDGPFADTKETLGGYFVVDVPDLDTAMEWARKCPAMRFGKVEIRASMM